MGSLDTAEKFVLPFIHWLRLALEAVGGLWVAVGFAWSLVELVAAHFRHRTSSFTAVRLKFSRYLSLALEFQLAADILSTAVAPTWDEIGKLAVIAAIRTGLNHFLSREMEEYAVRQQKEPEILREAHAPIKAEF